MEKWPCIVRLPKGFSTATYNQFLDALTMDFDSRTTIDFEETATEIVYRFDLNVEEIDALRVRVGRLSQVESGSPIRCEFNGEEEIIREL